MLNMSILQVLLTIICIISPSHNYEYEDTLVLAHMVGNTDWLVYVGRWPKCQQVNGCERYNGKNQDCILRLPAMHGDRTPDESTLYPTNPYLDASYYEPYGWGQLTNEGKRTEYNIGQELKERYATFLENAYINDVIDARTTDVNRTKMSLQLLTASLFPPTNELIWTDEFSWEPLSYNYLVSGKDKELRSYNCPTFTALYDAVCATAEIQAIDASNEWFYEYLTNHTGKTFSRVSNVFSAYFGFATQIEMGFPMEEWKTSIYPEPMKSIAVDYYYICTNTTSLKRIAGGFLIDIHLKRKKEKSCINLSPCCLTNGEQVNEMAKIKKAEPFIVKKDTLSTGFLLKKMLQDSTSKINGTLEPSERKLFLYSAHELNVALFLITLGVFEPDIPPYGSYVLVELHLVDGEYGIRLFYRDYSTSGAKVLVLPGCQEFCPFNEFVTLTADLIPEDDECGN